ncbi:uncharacterized protein LOC131630414 [Vicia villosa]|uniref:uncharacterized protein LOC131630414 n=1 Tax=Vicia villosa TaxID=3911 RepID=UPI00273C1BF0|nr:uncharacterized protein LOC131630414 [Vicia villosa]
MTLNLVQPKNILATLKWKEPDNVSNIRQVYNIRCRTNKAIMGDRSEMQQLLKLLDDNMLILDSTYKTNKYKLPLFEMVGVISIEKTYSLGFAFLECDKEDNLHGH